MLVALDGSFPRLVAMIIVITGISNRPGTAVLRHRDCAEFLLFRGTGSLIVDTLLHAIPRRSIHWCDRGRWFITEEILTGPTLGSGLLEASAFAVVSRTSQLLVVPERPEHFVAGESVMIAREMFSRGDLDR